MIASLAGVYVSDWTTPHGDVTADRAMIGDGCIEMGALAGAASRAGYHGDLEIEILNATTWQGADLGAWLDTAVARYLEV